MKRRVSRRVTGTASAMIILVLVLGGIIYLRTSSNAREIDNRSLRELTRIGQGIEGRVNNLQTVLKSLANDKDLKLNGEKPDSILGVKAGLIPNLTATIARNPADNPVPLPSQGQTAFKIDIAEGVLKLWYNGENDSIQNTIQAAYEFSALRPTLSSDYMETVFLADNKGSVFMWETVRAGVRIHELSAVDTLRSKTGSESGIGVSDIVQVSVAGQEYRLYVMPVRINLSLMGSNASASDVNYTKWILGGMIPVSEYRQHSLSLDPNAALILGFVVIAGFLVVPFVRVFTMGTKERLSVGHLLYLVIALIFGTGLAGLYLADVVHYYPLKESIREQMKATANTVVRNLDQELQVALLELMKQTDSLNTRIGNVNIADDFFSLDNTGLDSLRMRVNIPFDSSGFYPYYHMAFWTDTNGRQIAKWTPRSQNTPRVDVGEREYFQAIINDRGWKQMFHPDPDSSTCVKEVREVTDSIPYYIESIRSWTTGENLAVISIPWLNSEISSENNRGISAISTELASLTRPVLPAGVGLAVLDANARTLFHTRSERILEENFAEETKQGDLLRSILAARACKDLELNYGGGSTMIVVRPLTGRPLFLVLFKDMSLVDTIRFEAWFEGGALFAIWVALILILIFLLDRLTTRRMEWLWPDLDQPGKYAALLLISLPFIIVFISHATTQEHLYLHPATLLIPAHYLGLGLVVLSWGRKPNPRGLESFFGWILFVIAAIALVVLSLTYKPVPRGEIIAVIPALIIILTWLRMSGVRDFVGKWSKDFSPRVLYTTAMVSGLLVLGVLPGYLTYRFTFHDHSEHLVKYHQLELSESLGEQRDRIAEVMQMTWNIDSWDGLTEHNYDKAYNRLIFGTTTKHTAIRDPAGNDRTNHLHDSLHGLLDNRIPFLTEASVRMRQLSANQADRKWITAQGMLQLQVNDNELITSTIPAAGGWFESWRFLLLLGALGVLSLIVYRVSRWVFFIHLEHSDPLTLNDVLPKPGDEWKPLILVGTRSISREPLLRRSDEVHYVDMISLKTGPDDIPELPVKQMPKETRAFCLDYFDHRIEEAKWNRYMLEFLERNMFSGDPTPVILFTSCDLNETLLSAESDNGRTEEIKSRWDRVLGRFTKVILSDNVSPHLFEVYLLFRIIRKLTDDLNNQVIKIKKCLGRTSSQEKIEEIWQLIEESAVKLKWMKEKRGSLNDILHNIDKADVQTSLVSGQGFLNADLQKEAGIIEERMDKVAEEMQLLAEKYSNKSDGVLSNRLDLLAKKAIDESLRFAGFFDRITDNSEPVVERNNPQLSDTVGLRYRLQHFFDVIRMWIDPSADMKAERMVYREKKNIMAVYNTLLSECGRHERLHEIGRQIVARPDWFELKDEEVVDLIREGAETYFMARWAILTKAEQLVAAQLSRGAVVNPKSHQAVTRLFARGLIKRNPELQLDNKSFANFVNDAVTGDLLNKWERAGIPSTWELIRGPLIIALIIVALFLFWAQREFIGGTIAFLGTIGVGLGAILNLLSKLELGRSTSDITNEN